MYWTHKCKKIPLYVLRRDGDCTAKKKKTFPAQISKDFWIKMEKQNDWRCFDLFSEKCLCFKKYGKKNKLVFPLN